MNAPESSGTSLVVTVNKLHALVASEARRPIKGRVEVIAYNRKLGWVAVSDRLGNLYGDAWFDDIPFAEEIARILNEERNSLCGTQ